jgi:peptide-methionine (S)-S-oxide reductase
MIFTRKIPTLPPSGQALPGRPNPIPTADTHYVFNRPLQAPPPSGYETAVFGLGCFWGAERLFWNLPGIWLTRVGYAGGQTPNPTYEEVCSGGTGHTEVVEVQFDTAQVSFEDLMRAFLENHDPSQGMRQGNDIGTQYRSAVYTTSPGQEASARVMLSAYAEALRSAGKNGNVTTEIAPLDKVWLAEAYHQQYLAKNPAGYCGLGGTGVTCPLPVREQPAG